MDDEWLQSIIEGCHQNENEIKEAEKKGSVCCYSSIQTSFQKMKDFGLLTKIKHTTHNRDPQPVYMPIHRYYK